MEGGTRNILVAEEVPANRNRRGIGLGVEVGSFAAGGYRCFMERIQREERYQLITLKRQKGCSNKRD